MGVFLSFEELGRIVLQTIFAYWTCVSNLTWGGIFLLMTWINWSGYEKHLRGKAPRPVVGDLVAMKCHFPASHWRIIYPHNDSLILSQEVLKKFRSFEGESRCWRALSPITSILLVSYASTSENSSRRMKISFEENSEQLLNRYYSLAQNA